MATRNGGKICVYMKVEIISTLGSVGRSDQHIRRWRCHCTAAMRSDVVLRVKQGNIQ